MIRALPTATYRLQFNRAFTFADAARIVPYLHGLGISHCYVSPLLKARQGSSHGYDIVDHHALNPELGSWQDFENFIGVLHAHDMGLILDIVPNHMGIGGSDNRWWLDVLENGQSSRFAHYFDIDWEPESGFLTGKVLLPILGDQYGVVLDRGEIKLAYDDGLGSFHVSYHEHLLPVDPKTYPLILSKILNILTDDPELGKKQGRRLQYLIARCKSLPSRKRSGSKKMMLRRQTAEKLKNELLVFFRDPLTKKALAGVLSVFNGGQQDKSYDQLHGLLEKQAYRLAFWRVAADDINYRRFFNINSLAGIRMESQEVFQATHAFILDLIAGDKIQGLRIDHPDGLYYPGKYFRWLRREIRNHCPDGGRKFYLVVEKILAAGENLPTLWPVHGTTGYDFAALAGGLFVRPESRKLITSLYHRFIATGVDFENLLYNTKKFIIRVQLSSELTVLTNLLKHIAEMQRHTRDFTLNSLREALVEVVACLPVYRTYISPAGTRDRDQRVINEAVSLARKKSRAADISIFDFVSRILLPARSRDGNPGIFHKSLHFAMKFQQYTAAVMPKALEDTVFYVYNRLISLNEVGSDPRRFGTSLARFHADNRERLRHWPLGMLASTTHDTKRSGDVRARINVISEIPHEWESHVLAWRRINQRHRVRLQNGWAPSRNDEYHFYQTLVGTWPLVASAVEEMHQYQERLEKYMIKAVKEAKEHTSWINPSEDYEQAVTGFVRGVLHQGKTNPFLDDFLPLVKRIGRFGLLNSISETLLQLTSPGVPDIYQGNELWDFSLVDPDNRRAVNFSAFRERFSELQRVNHEGKQQLPALMDVLEDGTMKMLITWRVLCYRKQNPQLFQKGNYLPLEVQGARKDSLCAFAREYKGKQVIVMAGRFFAGLYGDRAQAAATPGGEIWQDTRVMLPAAFRKNDFINLFNEEKYFPALAEKMTFLEAARVLNSCPVAVLVGGGADNR